MILSDQATKLCALMSVRDLRRLWYVPLLSVSLVLMLVRTLLLARLLNVNQFADFGKGVLVSNTFTMLGCVGLQSVLQRELPIQFAKRRESAAHVLLAQCVIVATGCALLGEILALTGQTIAGVPSWLIAVGIVHGLSQQLFVVATVESRSRGDAVRFSVQNFARSLAVLGGGAAVAIATRSAGWTLATEAGLGIVLAQFYLRTSWQRIKVSATGIYLLGMRRLRKLRWSAPLALLTVSVIGFLMVSADRWLAARTLSQRDFALYAFAGIIPSVGQSLQFVMNSSVFPILARRYALLGPVATFRVCAMLSFTILSFGGLLAVPGVWIVNSAISRWFSPYASARSLIPIFVLISALRISDFWYTFLWVKGWEWRLLSVNILSILIGGLGWLVWQWSSSMSGIGTFDIAMLAAALALSAYVGSALAAWYSVRLR